MGAGGIGPAFHVGHRWQQLPALNLRDPRLAFADAGAECLPCQAGIRAQPFQLRGEGVGIGGDGGSLALPGRIGMERHRTRHCHATTTAVWRNIRDGDWTDERTIVAVFQTNHGGIIEQPIIMIEHAGNVASTKFQNPDVLSGRDVVGITPLEFHPDIVREWLPDNPNPLHGLPSRRCLAKHRQPFPILLPRWRRLSFPPGSQGFRFLRHLVPGQGFESERYALKRGEQLSELGGSHGSGLQARQQLTRDLYEGFASGHAGVRDGLGVGDHCALDYERAAICGVDGRARPTLAAGKLRQMHYVPLPWGES